MSKATKPKCCGGASAFGDTRPQGHPNREPLTSRGRRVKDAGLTEVAYDAFGHQLVPAKEVPMANALFLRDLDHVATRVAQTPPVRILGNNGLILTVVELDWNNCGCRLVG